MTPRWISIAYLVIGLAFIASGIVGLVRGDGDSASGGIQVALGIAWILTATFIEKVRTARGGRRTRG